MSTVEAPRPTVKILPRDLHLGDIVVWYDGTFERRNEVVEVKKTKQRYSNNSVVYQYRLKVSEMRWSAYRTVTPNSKIEIEERS